MNKPDDLDHGYDKYYEYLQSDRWEKLRTERLLKDDFQCAICGSKEQLHVHHIFYPAEYGTENIDDLLTVCADCHGILEKLKKQGRASAKYKRVVEFGMRCEVVARNGMEIYDFLKAADPYLPDGDIHCLFCTENEGGVLEQKQGKRTNLKGLSFIMKYFGDAATLEFYRGGY